MLALKALTLDPLREQTYNNLVWLKFNEKRMDVFIQIEKFIRTMEVPLLKADFAEEDSAVLQSEQNELPVNGQGQA